MLVSIHIPKSAGTSFSLSLGEAFGRALQSDYADRVFTGETTYERKRKVMEKALELRPDDFEGVECVHGHFLAFKYSLLAEQMPCEYVTWLREPIERLQSHYYYWLECFDPNTSFGLHRQCVEEQWSFEEFCFCEEFQNLQSKYLWGVPLSDFAFVGLTEHYAEDFACFADRYLGGEREIIRVNETKSKPKDVTVESGLRRRIEEFHADDVALYQAALERRKRSRAGNQPAAA